MKGKQRREEPMFACVRLEELIPLEHKYKEGNIHALSKTICNGSALING